MIRHVLNLKNALLMLSVLLLTYGLAGTGYTDTETGSPHFHGDTVVLSVNENEAIGTNVGAALTVHESAVADGTLAYKLKDGVEDSLDADNFRLDTTDLAAPQLKTRTILDRELHHEYALVIDIEVTTEDDITTVTDTLAIKITVNDVNERPEFTANPVSTVSVDENISGVTVWSPEGNIVDLDNGDTFKVVILPRVVVTIGTELPNASDTVTVDDFPFIVNEDTGVLESDGVLDYETKSSYTVKISVEDSGGLRTSESLTITVNVNDVIEPPYVVNPPESVSIDEGASGRDVYTFAADNIKDPEGGESFSMKLHADSEHTDVFTFSGLTLRTTSALDYETKDSYDITYQVGEADDSGYYSDAYELTINVNDANEAPIYFDDVELSFDVDEEQDTPFLIWEVVGIKDPDGDEFTISVSEDDSDSYKYRPHGESNLALTKDNEFAALGGLESLVSYNYETETSHTVTLVLTDENNNTSNLEVAINVQDVEETGRLGEYYSPLDPNLVSAIQDALDLGDDIPTETDMLSLISLDASQSEIENLDGIKFAQNLETLIIWGNDLEDADLTHIGDLSHLKVLRIGDNAITDVAIFGIFSNLEELGLANNDIVDSDGDVNPFAVLRRLKKLRIDGNEITDISALEYSTSLEELWISENEITDISSLAQLSEKLSVLYLDDNPIEDYSTLWSLTELTFIDIDLIADENLAEAIRSKFRLDDDAIILPANLDALKVLDAHQDDISSLEGLEYASNLEKLVVWDNNIDDISPLVDLESLTDLRLGQNDVSDLSDLSEMTQLTWLGLQNNDISDISVLANLTNLTELRLSNNDITDIEALSNLSSLTALHLNDNDIEDVEPLWNLSNLETLKLAKNPITWTTHLYNLVNVHDTAIDIDVHVPWDVNEDGTIELADSGLILTQVLKYDDANDRIETSSSGRAKRSRFDVNFDGAVDHVDVNTTIEKIGEDAIVEAATAAAPAVALLPDISVLKGLDSVALEGYLETLRADSDGSLRYQQAILLLEQLLLEMRPEKTALLANYPNPFNPETWIPYQLANPSTVQITIYNTQGVVVRHLDLGHQPAGYYTNRSQAAYWDGRNATGERIASGIYFYRFEADNVSLLRKMVILK